MSKPAEPIDPSTEKARQELSTTVVGVLRLDRLEQFASSVRLALEAGELAGERAPCIDHIRIHLAALDGEMIVSEPLSPYHSQTQERGM